MNEKELIRKCLEGDEIAFADLMQNNRRRVYQHCLRLVHDEEIAEDLTQETFVHAFQHLNTFKQKARFSTWVWRISHNLCLNYLKRHKIAESELVEEIVPAKEVLHDEHDEEHLRLIQEAMQKLPEKQRIVLQMFDFEHIPQKEIAARLGISHGTVRSRIHYARRAIRKFLLTT